MGRQLDVSMRAYSRGILASDETVVSNMDVLLEDCGGYFSNPTGNDAVAMVGLEATMWCPLTPFLIRN
jgi:hypothetical protein